MDLLTFLIPLATGLFWAGTALSRLMNDDDLRQNGVRVEARVLGPVPGAPASRSRSRGQWVINPLVGFTTPDGRSVQHAVGSRKSPVRVRADARITVFHDPEDPARLAVDGHGVRGRACSELVFGVSLTLIALLLLSRVT